MVLRRREYDVVVMLIVPQYPLSDGTTVWRGLVLKSVDNLWRAGAIDVLGPEDDRGNVDDHYWEVLS